MDECDEREVPFFGNQFAAFKSLDPAGVFLAGIVGTVGLLALMREACQIALPCLGLAGLGLFFSQSRFDRRENEDG
jgi:hypothetical protein